MTDHHSSSPYERPELEAQLRRLGVERGEVLVVHTSFRAVGPVQDGPAGLIAALLEAVGRKGTLVMPSWTGDDDAVFDPESTPASADLGIVAETFRRMPGVLRSEHPFAFAAKGPRAGEIVSGPLPLPPHIHESPIGKIHDLDGQVLLLGVGHDADTTIHLAECLAGVPYGLPKHITVLENGRPIQVSYRENDHCCALFAKADEWLRERKLQAEGVVGRAHAKLARSRDIVSVVGEHLAKDPLVFLHPAEAGCAECNEARGSITP